MQAEFDQTCSQLFWSSPVFALVEVSVEVGGVIERFESQIWSTLFVVQHLHLFYKGFSKALRWQAFLGGRPDGMTVLRVRYLSQSDS